MVEVSERAELPLRTILPLLFNNRDELDQLLLSASVPSSSKVKASDSTWLSACRVRTTRDGKFVAIASKTKIVLLSLSVPNTTDPKIISIDSPCTSNETITQLLVIPLAPIQTTSRLKSLSRIGMSQNNPQESLALPRIITVVGFSNGAIKFYSENGEVLLNQVIDLSAVLQLKLRTNPSLIYGGRGDFTEDLCILYESSVAIIEGLSLYNVLRACIVQVEKGYSYDEGLSAGSLSATLEFRKWELVGQNSTDIISFDLGAFKNTFTSVRRSSQQTSHHMIAVGQDPTIALFAASEDGSSFSAAVALASTVTTKLTSAVVSFAKNWWGGSSSAAQAEPVVEKKPEIQKAVPLSSKFYLNDQQRQMLSIVLDPTGRVAAATDQFGRVLLIDTFEGVVVRMWKGGYRDAQCGWLQHSTYDETEGRMQLTFFLVIYTPKRGMLEVWRMRHGGREAVLNVGIGCLLLNTNALLGAPSLPTKLTQDWCVSRCFLVQRDGRLLEVTQT